MEGPVISGQRPRLNELLDGVAGGVREALPELKTCAVHDGRFQAAELRRWSLRAPAVLVAWLGTPATETPGVSRGKAVRASKSVHPCIQLNPPLTVLRCHDNSFLAHGGHC